MVFNKNLMPEGEVLARFFQYIRELVMFSEHYMESYTL